MSGQHSPARDLAARLLNEWSRSGRFADVILGEALDSSALDPKDRSLAAELFLGVLRRRESLECVLRAFCSRPLKRMSPAVLNILRIGAYQIIFLARVPSYAAVDSAVTQAKKLPGGAVHKMVNAVLRSLDRCLAQDSSGDNAEFPRRALPLAPGNWRRFDHDIFAGIEEDPGLHISQVYSCPAWLARRWWARFDLHDASQVAQASVLRGPVVLRPNLLRTSSEELCVGLTNLGLRSGLMSEGLGVWVERISVAENQFFQAGHFQPQGPTAMRTGLFTEAQPGQKILDFCAGLGTKSTHLAELMSNEGLIVASDISAEKLRRAKSNAARLGISCIQFVHQSQLKERFNPRYFDMVLVDVPCSNTGVLANRPDVKWRISLEDLPELAAKQRDILLGAIDFLKPGGSLIYSTCSIEPVENDEFTTGITADCSQTLTFEKDKQYLPGITSNPADWRDGGYMARWRRK